MSSLNNARSGMNLSRRYLELNVMVFCPGCKCIGSPSSIFINFELLHRTMEPNPGTFQRFDQWGGLFIGHNAGSHASSAFINHWKNCHTFLLVEFNPHYISLNHLVEVLSTFNWGRGHTLLDAVVLAMGAVQRLDCFSDLLTHLFAFKQLQQHFFSRMAQVSVKTVGNSSCMRSMRRRRSQLSQSASFSIINCIDLLSEILVIHDGFRQVFCQNNAIVFSFSASLTTTRHGTF